MENSLLYNLNYNQHIYTHKKRNMNPITPIQQPKPRSVRLCSVCKQPGHDKRNCSQKELPTTSTPTTSHSTSSNTTRRRSPTLTATVDYETCSYCVFDLETTGFSRKKHDIIEICAIILDEKGHDSSTMYHSLVKPANHISPVITEITGISNEDVADAPTFQVVGNDFIKFLKENCRKKQLIEMFGDSDNDDDSYNHGDEVMNDILLVAHNGSRFDVPFLFHSFRTYGIDISGIPFKGQIDTLSLAKLLVKSPKRTVADGTADSVIAPNNYQLSTLYKYVTGNSLDDAHHADADAHATVDILTFPKFWDNRHSACKVIIDMIQAGVSNSPKSVLNDQSDSDTDADSDLDDSFDANEDINEEQEQYFDGSGGRWSKNTFFMAPNISARYDEAIAGGSTTRQCNERNKSCLKTSINTVNSPIKAWRYIFTQGIWNKIVQYTNDYGNAKCSNWIDITVNDLTDFISILFITSIQKRKDKPSNWWSNDPYYEIPVVKKIMTGKKFHMILRYLHVCDMHAQPSLDSPTYTPIYKVQEFMDYLEGRYQKAFQPGMNLSLDESLVRAFGRIKFKVRIVTKAARYGIKIYVIADAKTAFVLRVLVYTGQYTYITNNLTNTYSEDEMKKTVKVVKDLCEKYRDTHRVVYVDRFYTSIELMKELERMGLYVTGTCMSNRIPNELRIKKQSAEFKDMERGDHKSHLYSYNNDRGSMMEAGLVCWKDKDIVYCLTNATCTDGVTHCFRRSQTGRICITRPKAIGEYNTNMGGVDLADFRRLMCNSTIMGLHRWWLKLFFYNLDVGTANALVLYKEAVNNLHMNIFQFKRAIVDCLVGHKINCIPVAPVVEHQLVRSDKDSRRKCLYCDVYHHQLKRTRYYCNHPNCLLPLCAVGHGRSNSDCFTLAHANNQIRLALISQYEKIRRKAI